MAILRDLMGVKSSGVIIHTTCDPHHMRMPADFTLLTSFLPGLGSLPTGVSRLSIKQPCPLRKEMIRMEETKIETKSEKRVTTLEETKWYNLYNRLTDLLCKKVGCKLEESNIEKCEHCPIYLRSRNVSYYYSMGWNVLIKNCCYDIKTNLKSIVLDAQDWLLHPFILRTDTTTHEWFVWNTHTHKRIAKIPGGDPDRYHIIRSHCTQMNNAHSERVHTPSAQKD